MIMKIRICTVVTGENLQEFLKNLKKIQSVSDMIELRVDGIKGIKPEDVPFIKKTVIKPSVFTCRREDEGGKFSQSEKMRIQILNEAVRACFEYVDIELSTMEESALNLKRHKKTKLIISYHNFIETPDGLFLKSLIKKMEQFHPDIVKLATMVNNDYDNRTLFRLITDCSFDYDRIIIGMGEKGQISRIIGPLLGNYLTYSTTSNGKKTLGQIHLSKLRSLYQLMGV